MHIEVGDKKRKDDKLRVLFLGPYRQPDEWGASSRSIVHSLSLVKEINLTLRPLFLAEFPPHKLQIDPNIFRGESNKQEGYDVLIQHSLPSLMVRNGAFDTHVGIVNFETKGNTSWDNHLSLLDKIFVRTKAEKDCISSHLQDKAYVIGGAISPVPLGENPVPTKFSFYTFAGNLETKGGILSLLQAYMSEFHINENVSLIIYAHDVPTTQELISATASSMGIYASRYYPHIHIVQQNPEDSLHKQCHCLVDASVTRGFKEEVAKGLAYGRTPIILDGSGMDEYVNDSNGWIVKSNESILMCADRPFPSIFTARETCLVPDKLSLKRCMRSAFESHMLNTKKRSQGKASAKEFSLEKQSSLIKEILCSQ